MPRVKKSKQENSPSNEDKKEDIKEEVHDKNRAIIGKPMVLRPLKETGKTPIILQNENIDKNIYIVQSAYNIPNALFILDVWIDDNYNIGEVDRYLDETVIPYTKILYNSNSNIQRVDVNGGSDDYKILLYKKDGRVYTSALLKYTE